MFQIRNTLPRAAWETISVNENHEPLVLLIKTQKLKLGKGIIDKGYETSVLVRKTIAKKLYRVSEKLPSGINLVVIEGFRSVEHQQVSWDNLFQKLKQENPNLDDEEIEKLVRLVIARPNPLANHNCGGAVDVALSDENGNLLDMGTLYPSEPMGVDWQEIGQVENTGFFLDSKFFYPGDNFTNPQKQVDILAAPVYGPWITTKSALEYILEIKPKKVFAVHDAMMVPGRMNVIYSLIPKICGPEGIEYVEMNNNSQEVEF